MRQKDTLKDMRSEPQRLTWGAVEQQGLPGGHQSCEQLWILSEQMQIRPEDTLEHSSLTHCKDHTSLWI